MPDAARSAWVAALWTLCAATIALSAILGARLIFAPYSLGYTEGWVLWQVERVWPLHDAFQSPFELPYAVFRYPPVYHLATRVSASVTGLDPLFAGRLVTFGATGGLVALAGWLVHRGVPGGRSRDRWLGAATAMAMTVALPSVRTVFPLLMVDLTAVFLTVAGLCVYAAARGRPGRQMSAVLLFGLAVFVKPIVVAAPLACALHALWRRDLRFLGLGASGVAVAAAVVWALEWTTGGEFLGHVAFYDHSPFRLEQLARLMGRNAWVMLPVLGVLILEGRNLVRRRTDAAGLPGLLGAYLLLSLSISLLAAKVGSGGYYFIEWNVVACVFVGWAVARAAGAPSRVAIIHRAAVVTLTITWIGLQMPGLANNALQLTTGARRYTAGRIQEFSAAVDRTRALPGPVWSDDAAVVVLAGKEPAFQLDFMPWLAVDGLWDEGPFVRDLRDGHFDAIVLKEGEDLSHILTPAMWDAFRVGYMPGDATGLYQFYYPRRR